MTLTALKATQKTAAITEAFMAVGVTGETRMPRSGSNHEPVAWEYFVALHLARLAEARKKKAHATALANGMVFDHETEPKPSGTHEVLHAGEIVEIAVKVSNASEHLDIEAFIAELEDVGVDPELIDNARSLHTKPGKPAHKFNASLITA
jgi:hypothetical protein